MRQFLSRLWRWGPFRRSVMIYLALRVGLSLWAILALTLVPADLGPTDPNPPRPYLGLEPILEGVSGRLLGPWQRFDTLHYLYLAIHGYQPGTPQTVFAPLYPALIRWVGEVFARQYLVAALIISNLSAIGYLTVFSVLAESEIGAPAMHKAQAYAALYPWAFFLLAGYAEPLFLLLVALTLWMSLRGQGWAAGLFGLLAALTRLQGATLVVPLLFQAVRARRFRLWPLRADLLWPLLPGLGGAAFLIGRAWAGLEPISMTYATHWGQAFALPWVGMMTIARNALQGTAHLTDYFDLGIVLSFIALVVAAWRKLDPLYALYATVALLFNISYLRTPHPLSGMGRHTMELFPVFFLLGVWGSRSAWLNRLILYPFILLWLWMSGQFFLWGWVG